MCLFHVEAGASNENGPQFIVAQVVLVDFFPDYYTCFLYFEIFS